MTATNEAERKQQLRDFQRSAHRLLSEDDRDYLHYVMKEYQTYKSVEKLVSALRSCLDTPRKLDLLADIRNLIPKAHLSKFDSLVPYHKMAHPIKPPNQIAPDRKTQSLNLRNGELKGLQENGDESMFKVVTLVKTDPDQVLGLSIRGGREHGCGVYISQVDSDSQAEKQGLHLGDQIIEVNGIDFEQIAQNSAINLLSSLSKMKLVIRTGGKMPDILDVKSPKNWEKQNGKVSPREKAGDDSLQNSSAGSGSNYGITLQPNHHILNSSEERRVNLVVEPTQTGFIGFNLRGGAEYGLGIYVSGVDQGSLAEQAGFRVGDQILNVNDKSFENIKHKEAVDFIKSNKHIIVTLKAAGKLPEAKHYSSEISWILPDGTVVRESKEHFSRSLSQPPSPVSPMDLSSTSAQLALSASSKLSLSALENNNHPDMPKPELREFGVQTPDIPMVDANMSPVLMSTPCQSPTPATPVQGSPELQRATSAKSVATTASTTSSGDKGSTNSREDLEKRYSSTNADVIMVASGSDEAMRQDDKKKVKKSKSFLQKHGDKIRSKLSFRKKSKPKTETKGGPTKQQMLLYIEERAKKILVVDEYDALIKHIIQYLDNGDVEVLVKELLAILDKPEKALLLRDIRSLISPYDLGRFDAMVSVHEKGAQEYLSVCVPGSPTIIPTAVEKPKRQLVAVIQDSRGGFQIRSNAELERIRKEKEEQAKMHNQQLAWLGGNILDRQMRQGTSEYYAVQSTTPEPGDMRPVKDSGLHASPGPMAMDIPLIQIPNGNMNGTDSPPVGKSANTLMVPDRVAVEYQDDDDDEAPAAIGSQQSAFVPVSVSVPSIAVSDAPSEQLILLPKNRTSLGISISGGKGSKTQPEIRIEKVFPGGAAADDGRLKNGDEVISVDGMSLKDVTHAEAVDIIRRSYNDKSKTVMQIVVFPKQ